MSDSDTKNWIYNTSDELAVKNGCKFDGERGQFVIDWFADYLRFYEGDRFADQPFECMPWQVNILMRMFSWIRYSDHHQKWIRRFRKASIWVPKKNGKSPLLAALGLYLLCGDGEPGQKVFFGAKDGTQAREVAGKHALEMLRKSPALMSECTINKSLMQVTHEPTRSILKPLSSSDARSQQSKEGLNGSLLVDETHVVDQSFADITSRMGISRTEPFQIEVSTAGNNPDGYGKAQFDHGEKVEMGAIEEQDLFYVAYAADQKVNDADILNDPVKYGKAANPSWGVTINPEEFVSDCLTSHNKGISEFANCKMYRLNVWQNASSPWLRLEDWMQNALEYDESNFKSCIAYLGLDCSHTMDFTSAVFAFPSGDEDEKHVYLLPLIWLPEFGFKKLQQKVRNIEQWVEDGHLRIIPGKTIKSSVVKEDIEEMAEEFTLQEIVYDAMYGSILVESLAESTGATAVEFRQSMMEFAEPCQQFETMIVEGRLHHNNNPVLNWQIGHVNVKMDESANKRPVKAKHGNHKKIDSVVASIMANTRAVLGAVEEEWDGVAEL